MIIMNRKKVQEGEKINLSGCVMLPLLNFFYQKKCILLAKSCFIFNEEGDPSFSSLQIKVNLDQIQED